MDLMYLDNLDEYIQDEGKIVTYRWLSLTLKVSSDIAKQMLFHYWDKNKETSKDEASLSLTYLLSGIRQDEKLKQDVHKVCVVRDDELEAAKSRFKKVFSLHIYSIQRGRLKDLHTLYGVDHDKIKENVFSSNEYSSIKCPSARLRTPEETAKLVPKKEETPKESATDTKSKSPKEDDRFSEDKENKSSVSNIKKKPPPNKKDAKGSLASLFAGQVKKMAEKPPVVQVKKEGRSALSSMGTGSKGPKKGSISAFLTKRPKEEPRQPVVKEEEEVVKIEEEEVVKMEVEEEEEVLVVKMEEEKEAPIKEVKPKVGGGKSHKQSQKGSKGAKTGVASKGKRSGSQRAPEADAKRRRILTLDSSSSESSEEEEGLLEECPVPSPPSAPAVSAVLSSDEEEEVTPSSQAGERGTSKRRKKKMVTKTFMGEDGFLVTKTKFEFVTDSDEEEDPIPAKLSNTPKTSPPGWKSPKKKSKTSPKSQKSPSKSQKSPSKSQKSPSKSKKSPTKSKKSPSKSKQASITSFFKKK